MPTANERNRGYYKIKGAVDAFNFDFTNKTVLDIGSSTGGFTEFALNRGARKVIAIEKGTNQMKKPLRFDPRIDLHEKTDIFDIRISNSLLEDHSRPTGSERASEPRNDGRERSASSSRQLLIPATDVVVADVSFVSLKKVLKHVSGLKRADFLVMLKPQFEAKPFQLTNGVVKNETVRRDIIKNFEFWLKKNDFIIVKKHDNDLKGKNGNKERFYWLRKTK